jgi:HSP20 family protein
MKTQNHFPMLAPRAFLGLGLRDDLDRVFDSLLPAGTQSRNTFVPPVDIEETAEEFVIHADVPGVSQKDLKVSLMGDTLTIRGERTFAETPGNRHRAERMYGAFERTFQLATPVRGDKIRATFRDGVLEIRVPKADEARRRDIEIEVA